MEAPRSVETTVTDALRAAIQQGHLLPGAKLGQAELAAELGVSRIPLRDAFRSLASEGLIELDGRRGARVASLSVDDVAEIYEMRILLERACMRHAVDRLSPEEAHRIVQLSLEMDRAAGDQRVGPVTRLDFYGTLYEHAGRPRMREAIVRLRAQVDRYHLLNPGSRGNNAHTEIRQAIEQRDGERASMIIAEHLAEARDDLVASMQEAPV